MALNILLTNDDGIEAQGLWKAKEVLDKIGVVWIVAPDKDQSGVSHSLTLRKPLRVEESESKSFKVSGTPTDCVLLAYHHIMTEGIDLVVAGINHGYNMGYDVFYSGTVAAALQGGILGITSIAISVANTKSIAIAAKHLPAFIEKIKNLKYKDIVLNINFPQKPKGFKITKLGKRIYQDKVIIQEENKHVGYYVIDGTLSFKLSAETDFQATEDGFISVTPLNLDLTDHKIFEQIKNTLSFS